jgi:hypothetical protein
MARSFAYEIGDDPLQERKILNLLRLAEAGERLRVPLVHHCAHRLQLLAGEWREADPTAASIGRIWRAPWQPTPTGTRSWRDVR